MDIKQASEIVSFMIASKLAKGYSQEEAIKSCLSPVSLVAPAGREVKTVRFKGADVSMGDMEFAGYASTWDRDEMDDIIEMGAFSKTIRERRDKIKVLFQHDSHQPIGKPVEMREDARGLYTHSRLSDTTLGRDTMTLIKDGVIDRMSIGFSIPAGKFRMHEDGITRTITEVKLYEYSPVTFAANEEATIEMASRLSRSHTGQQLSEASKTAIRDLIRQIAESEPPAGTRDNEPDGLTDLHHSIGSLAEWARHRLY